MGALLAYEWARRIQAAGLPQPMSLFVSGRRAPQLALSHTTLHRLAPEALVRELKSRYGGEPEAVLGDPELRELFLPVMRSDLQVVETYKWQPGERLRSDLLAFAGEEDRSVSEEGLAHWSTVTKDGFASRRFPGDHFYHFGKGQSELLRVISEVLETRSSATQSSSWAKG